MSACDMCMVFSLLPGNSCRIHVHGVFPSASIPTASCLIRTSAGIMSIMLHLPLACWKPETVEKEGMPLHERLQYAGLFSNFQGSPSQ